MKHRPQTAHSIFIILTAAATIALSPALHAQIQSTNDLPLVQPESVPQSGTFWKLSSFNAAWGRFIEPPLPFNPVSFYNLTNGDFYLLQTNAFVLDDSSINWPAVYDAKREEQMTMSLLFGDTLFSAESTESPESMDGATLFPSNSLWIQAITVTNGSFPGILHGTVPGEIYELMSTPALGTTNAWNPEQALHAQTNQDWTPFLIPVLDRTNALFIWARLWTTNDENSNGLPDWWEWENFGNFNQTANGDYDGDGINNLQEYLAGTDPNTVDFSVEAAPRITTNIPAAFQVAVALGAPASMAVLVDNTNFESAVWAGFTANPSAYLGTNEGWHQVWVGLRGRKQNSQQTWHTTTVKLDRTPPSLVITNPTSASVSIPVIQLSGYCSEALSAITYDLANSLGVATNLQALVTRQFFSTNTSEFTTNFWQGFDVGLTSGSNTITLHATDLAGNSTVTNITFTLDYSGKTNPSSIALNWPQDSTRVSGSAFTWRGRVDDQTVRVMAQMVDTNGFTNVLTGIVARSGDFQIQAIPLAVGTNLFTVVTTDAAGNVSSTNAAVI